MAISGILTLLFSAGNNSLFLAGRITLISWSVGSVLINFNAVLPFNIYVQLFDLSNTIYCAWISLFFNVAGSTQLVVLVKVYFSDDPAVVPGIYVVIIEEDSSISEPQ